MENPSNPSKTGLPATRRDVESSASESVAPLPLPKSGELPSPRDFRAVEMVPPSISFREEPATAIPSLAYNCPACGNVFASAVPGEARFCASCSSWVAIPGVKPIENTAENPDEKEPTTRTARKRIERTGDFKFKPFVLPDAAASQLEFERESLPEADSQQSQAPYLQAGPSVRKYGLGIAIVAVLLIFSAFTWGVVGLRKQYSAPNRSEPEPVSLAVLRSQAHVDAEETLRVFLSDSSVGTRAEWLIGGSELEQAIAEQAALAEASPGPGLPVFAETDYITAAELSEQDIRRGIYSLIYEPLEDVANLLGGPLLPADVSSGIEAPSFLEAAAAMDSLSRPAPRRALAIFVLQGDRMLLDWHVFVQTWNRSFSEFRDGELGEGPTRFRVLIAKDHRVFENNESFGNEIYRLWDPLHSQDVIRIQIDPHHPVAVQLRRDADELDANPDIAFMPRTATVDLSRDPDTQAVSLDKIVCWEFLGVGTQDVSESITTESKSPSIRTSGRINSSSGE